MLSKMRRWLPVATILAGFACGLVRADGVGVHVDLDLTDFDDDSMRDMDDANKDLQPVADAQVIQNVLKETEGYFTKKGGTDNAVKIAQQGEAAVETVIAALGKNDFDTAAAAARATAKNCRASPHINKPQTK
jgi:hypothetical protein